MIISHQYRYNFVQTPRTASTAIGRELQENYGGIPILRKHAHYSEFLRIATAEEKKYFVFGGIRNPLDEAMSSFFKMKSNHKGTFTNPKRWKKNGGFVTKSMLTKYNFIQNNNANFPAFFKKFYRLPYDSWTSQAHKDFDFVIRFEYLQEDFARALALMDIPQIRPLPLVNPTAAKSRDYLSYYTPDLHLQARWVFGPYMKKWGYDFPPEWDDSYVPRLSQIQYHLLGVVKRFYWKHLKQNPYFTAFRGYAKK
jgi:hypothetical protein